jgi:hypothetical protein
MIITASAPTNVNLIFIVLRIPGGLSPANVLRGTTPNTQLQDFVLCAYRSPGGAT